MKEKQKVASKVWHMVNVQEMVALFTVCVVIITVLRKLMLFVLTLKVVN